MRPFVISILALVFAGCSQRYALLEQAEELSRQGEYAQAIAHYREHIEWRLSLTDRPSWENPYFYLLLIGDLQLAQGEMDEAIRSFNLAEKNEVEKSLVSDRYRYAASLLEKQGKLREALELLNTYRDRDPLLYDLILDRISKEQVRLEDQPAQGTPSAATKKKK